MDLHFGLHNVFVSNDMEEFSHLANMPGSKLKFPYKNLVTEGSVYTFKTEDLELFDRVRREFVQRVDQYIMQQYHQEGAKFNSLRVDFLLGSEHKDTIDKWIGCAIAKGAERIALFFSHNAYGVPNLEDPYTFPHTLFSEMKHLHLTNCLLSPHREFSGFKHLKTLVLEELVVEEDLLLCLFSKCSHLEDLTFIRCQFNRIVNVISPTLHHLKLISCHIPWRMDIVTSNLSSLEFGGDTIMVFNSINAPQLAKFYLNSYCRLKKLEELEVPHSFALLASIHQLQNLSMVLFPSQVARFPRTVGPFQNLREMELFFNVQHEDGNGDFLWVLNMVMACPRLQKLYFGILCPALSANQRQRREHPGFSHKELKYVELHGCVGHITEIELAIHFLKNVNSLEHITFGPRARAYIGAGEWFDDFERPHWFETGRDLIREQLRDYVNDGRTKLIFL